MSVQLHSCLLVLSDLFGYGFAEIFQTLAVLSVEQAVHTYPSLLSLLSQVCPPPDPPVLPPSLPCGSPPFLHPIPNVPFSPLPSLSRPLLIHLCHSFAPLPSAQYVKSSKQTQGYYLYGSSVEFELVILERGRGIGKNTNFVMILPSQENEKLLPFFSNCILAEFTDMIIFALTKFLLFFET